jgi:hypothetical protein
MEYQNVGCHFGSKHVGLKHRDHFFLSVLNEAMKVSCRRKYIGGLREGYSLCIRIQGI